ncbi:B12-binding domain-containing radical SAM protein [Azospirillum thermophilum]|uniref:Uncharacterized protein n=1 Tax=Azospirillum thermophilum TaxID=2202148 RepID=A0A2S2CV48_9PROT|nr:radical SAM protein [Azospirillum thermophilum]AWK88358.1 hypothetical protein DEW08_19920 [Azospirillum thermophilum]
MPHDVTLVDAGVIAGYRDFMPVGPLYLASALAARGRRVEFADLRSSGSPFDFQSMADLFEAADSPVIGVSLLGNSLPVALAASREYRRRGGGKTIVFGGPGPNGVESRLLERFPEVDIVVRGEGEVVFPDLLDALERKASPAAPGVVFRDADGNIQGSQPQRIADIDALPWPDRSLAAHNRFSETALLTARGCPFTCSFCDIIAMWGRSVGYRALDDVVREAAAITASGFGHFNIIDDTFTVNRKRVLAFCRALRAEGLTARWSCFARIDLVDGDLLDEMAAAGCDTIFYGVDSSTEDGWKKINKKLTRDMVIDTIGQTLKRCNVTPSLIWGYPFETFADFCSTVELAYDLAMLAGSSPHRINVQTHFLAPEPATPLFEEYGHTVRFGETMPLSFFEGSPLKAFSACAGYAECLELVRSDPVLFAPFHFYPSERLLEKLLVMQGAPGLPGHAGAADDGQPCGDGRDVATLARKMRFVRSIKPRFRKAKPAPELQATPR